MKELPNGSRVHTGDYSYALKKFKRVALAKKGAPWLGALAASLTTYFTTVASSHAQAEVAARATMQEQVKQHAEDLKAIHEQINALMTTLRMANDMMTVRDRVVPPPARPVAPRPRQQNPQPPVDWRAR